MSEAVRKIYYSFVDQRVLFPVEKNKANPIILMVIDTYIVIIFLKFNVPDGNFLRKNWYIKFTEHF